MISQARGRHRQDSLKSLLALSVALGSLVLAVGCDKVCKYLVNDVATIHNLTGRAHALTVCKYNGMLNGSRKVGVQIPAEHTSSVSLGVGESETIQGGPSGSCQTPVGENRKVAFVLAAESFNAVKLCRQFGNEIEYTLVDVAATCPPGTQAQTSIPTDCQ